jgi:DNA helicase-2/ATP-dependent DNA helicase PcrA
LSSEENPAQPTFDLNPEQQEAVKAIEGPVLVVAGAGSGKTRVIIEKIRHLIEEGLKPYSILAITFTNKAATEMRERLQQYGIDGPWVCTFHSMCVRILRKEAQHLGLSEQFSIFDDDDQSSILRSVIKEMELDPDEWKIKNLSSQISMFKNSGKSVQDVNDEAEHYSDRILARVYALYEKALQTNQALDFDDLLIKTIQLFHQHSNVVENYRRRFNYILVDEYQDTNQIQYQLIQLLTPGTQGMTLTGDPDQSIYSWRGADITNILNFQRDFPGAQVIKMERNYRSYRNILELSNQLIRHNTERYPKELQTQNQDGPTPTLHHVYSAEEESKLISQHIGMRHSEGWRFKDMAIFYRTNAQSRSIEDALRNAGISYILIGGVRFFDRMEVKDLIAYLRFIHNPSDSISLMRIVNRPSRGISETTKGKIRDYADDNGLNCWQAMIDEHFLSSLPKRAKEAVQTFNQMVADFFELSFSSPDVLVEQIVERTSFEDMFKKKSGDIEEDRIENVEEFVGYTREYSQKTSHANLSGLLEEIALVNDKKDGDEDSENSVTLMTLHASKGLEFPLVYFAGLDEGLLPHQRSLDMGTPSAVEEERRLCYVGITRAQKELHLYSARERYTFKGPRTFKTSRFISEMEGQHLALTKNGKPVQKKSWQEPFKKLPLFKKELRRGAPVQHERYGKGIVMKIDGQADKQRAKVFFDKHGEKVILFEYETLEIL